LIADRIDRPESASRLRCISSRVEVHTFSRIFGNHYTLVGYD
jgi:hypothetical protein